MRLRSTRLVVTAVSFVIIYALLLGPLGSGLAQSRKKTRKQKETAEQKAVREKREAAAHAALNALAASQGYGAASSVGQDPQKRTKPVGGAPPVFFDDKEQGDLQSGKIVTEDAYTIPYKGTKGAKAPASPPGRVITPLAPGGYGGEVEPNGTSGTATPIASLPARIQANIFPGGDVDFYSFTANMGDRIYAATMTSWSANSSTDSQLTLLASDGTTTIEFDDDDGTLGGLSSSIAGAMIPSNGTYFIRVNHFTASTGQLRPYELYVRAQSGAPTPEVEANDSPGTANPLPMSGWVSGARNPALATEQDWFSFTANAGDTIYLGLDLDPERDTTTFNGRLGIALFGDADNQILVVDDAGTVDVIDSEALFFTVKNAGTYYAFVDSANAATGGPTATYNLSVTVFPKIDEGVNCTTYTSTNVPQTIGPGAGLVSSTITVPGNPRIADLDVSIQLTHTRMADLDVHLRSPNNPEGNDNGIFTDIGATATGGQTMMDVVWDDEAAIPPLFTVLRPVSYKPELNYRLNWFDGEDAGGTWTLDIRDDLAAEGGTLTGWSLRICEQPAVSGSLIYSENFDGSGGTDGGFTHSGTADEWERGLPTTAATTTTNPVAAFTTCNSGTNCWKTDLDNTYNVSSNQDLLSPNISLAGVTGPITLEWAMRYQIENATFDHARVVVQQVGMPATARTVWEFQDATMTDAPGSPTVNIGASAGWGRYRADISSFSGQNIEVIFHLDTDTSINFGGLAIDDVAVYGTTGTPATAGQLLISEFRLRGPGAANDEFIEIYNNSGAAHTVSAVSGTGYGVAASDGVTRCTIPNGTVIPNKGHYLCTNSVAYSLAGYAAGDATYTTDIPDNAGIALFNNNTGGGSYTLANRLDAVGSTAEANTLYKEGTGYPSLTPFSIDYSFVRDNCGKGGSITTFGPCPSGGLPVDTNNNATDFYFVDTNGTSAGAGQRLGAPGPENLTSPIERNSVFGVVLLDGTVGGPSPPNRVRDFTSDPANNSTFGTLDIRRRVVNNTGGSVTRLRFRVVDLTTFPAPSGIADLRPRTSSLVVVSGINDAATCLASNGVATTPCTVNVQGTTLEQPPSQPNGGGFNSTLSAGTITLGTPLANGASINVHFLLGIQQTGSFKFFVNVEALP